MSIDNKKIAKNTLFLYLRMLVTMVVSLYTSRVIIRTLGLEDYGIYNIVGGVIVMFSFISTALRSSTQRFVSYELGRDNIDGVNRVINVSLECHAIISMVIFILAETIGLWFVKNQLEIPSARINAAVIVYQISVLAFIAHIFQAPYHAVIISHERMSFYALVSIVDVVLKLLVAFLVQVSGFDKLISYALLMLIVAIISLFLPLLYCYKAISLQRPKFVKDKALMKEIFGFSGWSMFSGSTYIIAQQGGNILVNIFSGVIANGAFAIANQVTSIVYGFVSNFQSAFNPQIVKTYSSSQHEDMFKLMNRSSLFSYFLFLLIAVPFVSETDYILSVWLGECPPYAAGFCKLLMVYFIVDALEAPLWMLIGATGKMKVYSLWSGSITILNVPISYILLKMGFSVYWVFIIRVILNIVCSLIRPFYLKHLVPSFSLRLFFKDAVRGPIVVTVIIAIALSLLANIIKDFHPLVVIALSLLFTVVLIWSIGLSSSDRQTLIAIIKSKVS